MSGARHHGYPCPMNDVQITNALYTIGGYSPEGVAVQETIAYLRAENERLRRLFAEIRDALRALLAEQDGAGAMDEKLPAVVDRFGECLMCGRTYRAGLPARVAVAARAYTKAVWDHEHCECHNEECIHMVAKRVAAYEVANAAVTAKDGTDG